MIPIFLLLYNVLMISICIPLLYEPRDMNDINLCVIIIIQTITTTVYMIKYKDK